jgi:hypothetical protein
MIESRYIDFEPDRTNATTLNYSTTWTYSGVFCCSCGKEMYQELNGNVLGGCICINCGTKVIEK